MNKADLVASWAALGDARPGFDEYEREMTRPYRSNPYGFINLSDIADMLFREEYCWMYFKLRHAFYSRRVAQLKAAERRPRYYVAENARRRALADERRKVRARRTTNACPSKDQILDAWRHRRDSHEAAMRFGGIVEDLECYLDNSLIRDEDGAIIGRNPGIKGWLFDNLPELSEHYTTVMRFKAAAKKMRQIAGLTDPTPVDVVLPSADVDAGADDGASAADCVAVDAATEAGETVAASTGEGKRDYGADEIADRGEAVPEVEVVRARAIWEEVVKGIGGSATALFERIDALTDPERVEEANMLAAWREKYENKITVRTKFSWWTKKLWKKSG